MKILLTRDNIGRLQPSHNMWHTRFYKIWDGIKGRCLRKNLKFYKHYGGRGIKICDNWIKFEGFRDDMYESYLEHCQEFGEKQTKIDRIDVNGNYCKENCRWATHKEQMNNMRGNLMLTYKGKTKSCPDWAREIGMKISTLKCRILMYGFSVEKAIEKPVKLWRK